MFITWAFYKFRKPILINEIHNPKGGLVLKIVIVGGVAAGASAATKARRINEDAEIIIFEKGQYVSFANCGLPYYVGGDILKKDNLLLVTPQIFKQRFNIDVRVDHEVIDIDPHDKKVTVKSGKETFTETYDKLILATGCRPVQLSIPGINLHNVFTVFTVNDAENISAALCEGIDSAVIVGGGFIGLETAEALLKKGIKTTLVEKLEQLIPNFDPEFSVPLERHFKDIGLELKLGVALKTILGQERVEAIELDDGSIIKAQMVIMSIGAVPQLELAKKAGVAIGQAGGVLVDATMQTSVNSIFAAGDIVESMHLVSREKVRIPLAGSANKQGRIAGANAVGSKMLFKGVLGTAIIKVGELTVARTGLNEREAKELGMKYYVSYVPSYSNACYYPGAKIIQLKIVFEQFTGKLLGAQAIGSLGVDKRIDVLSTAIYAGLTVFDLENLDLAYAPPYNSAKDASIMAGMTAANILRGEVRHVTPSQMWELKKNPDYIIVDVRTPNEYSRGAVDGAINLPVDDLRQRYRELDKSKKIILYCAAGYRSYNAYRFLIQKGYNVYNLSGGYKGIMMYVWD